MAARRRSKPDDGCELAEEAIADTVAEVATFLDPFTTGLVRREQKNNVLRYVRGKLQNLPRRTIEPIAIAAGIDHTGLQKFVGAGAWDDEVMRGELCRDAARTLGRRDGVLIVDGSGFPKKGDESVGVQRQWCGRLGKEDNCQVGEFLAYAAGGSYTLLDAELYLPRHWLTKAQRAKARIPEEREFRTGWEVADELIQRRAGHIPHAWITADESYGVPNAFRDRLHSRKENYVLEVKPGTKVWPMIRGIKRDKATNPETLFKTVPVDSWRRFHARDGDKEPLEVDVVALWVTTPRKVREEERVETLLLVKKADHSKTWQFLSNAPKGTHLSELVRVASCRHAVEEVLELAKGDVGLDEYEVRSYVGWHHHVTLTMLALWFTVKHHLELEKKHQRSPFLSSDGLWLWRWSVEERGTSESRRGSRGSSAGTKGPGVHIGGRGDSSRRHPEKRKSPGTEIVWLTDEELRQ
jgi:SRSO17 transposase